MKRSIVCSVCLESNPNSFQCTKKTVIRKEVMNYHIDNQPNKLTGKCILRWGVFTHFYP